MWKYLYDALLQFLTSSWASFLTKFANQGRLVRDTFFNEIYYYSGIILLFGCLGSCLLYYFYFNKKFGRYYFKKTWLKWMITTSFFIGLITFFVGKSFVSSFLFPINPLLIWMSVINFTYGLLLFFIFSLICQVIAIVVRRITPYDLSPMGSRTPF